MPADVEQADSLYRSATSVEHVVITDADFLLDVLRENPNSWVSQGEILQRSADARGCGMTVHSRASDLRNRGHVIENRCERVDGRVVSYYRLLSKPSGLASGMSVESDGLESEAALARPGSLPVAGQVHQLEPEDAASLEDRRGAILPPAFPLAPPATLFDDEPLPRKPVWA